MLCWFSQTIPSLAIIPDKNAVVACLSHSPNGARMLNSIWTNVYDNL